MLDFYKTKPAAITATGPAKQRKVQILVRMPGTQEGDGRNRTCHLGRTCSKNNPNSPESPVHIVQKLNTRYTYEKIIMWSGRSVEFLPDKYSMPYSFFFCKFCESFFGSFAVLLFTFFVTIFCSSFLPPVCQIFLKNCEHY